MRLFIVSILAVLLAFSCPFVTSEVLKTFDKCREFFFRGQPPVIPGILNPRSENDRYKTICQKYTSKEKDSENVGSGYMFATLYDTTNRIPVFSAYKYTGRGDFRRPKSSWMVEPQVMISIACFLCFREHVMHHMCGTRALLYSMLSVIVMNLHTLQ